MRLLSTFKSEEEALQVSYILTKEGIQNQMEGKVGTDWGSDDYGTLEYFVWVIDEDQTDAAFTLLHEFQKNPHRFSFQTPPPSPPSPPPPQKKMIQKSLMTAPITNYLIAICTLIFAWEALSSPEFKSQSGASYSPIYMSPIKQDLLYDFPESYQILETLVTQYGIDALKNPQNLPSQGTSLVRQLKLHSYWTGYYEQALVYFTQGKELPESNWFEKIRQGQVWRIFTPVFLHADIFHLLFNMIWLYVLGRQIEIRLKPFRYLLFIAIAAALTNTVQYLVSGPNFLGFSGVLCAMLTFIWKRQNDAPWDGYQLQPSTFIFMMIFIFGMFGLQTLAFALEVLTGFILSTSIANAAHISGLIVGIVFASIPYLIRENS